MDYGYVNARVRGMKSRLLDHAALENLIFQPDIPALIADLEKSPYKEDIIEAKVQFSGVLCIEHALRKNFTRTFRTILEFVKDSEAEQYIRIFLHRWDVQNIKTILRGKNIAVTNDEIRDCLVPAGELDEITLTELIKQPDTRAVIDMLATWEISYARPLTQAFPEFREHDDLAVLECALDKFYYTDALETVREPSYNNRLISDLIRTEIDVVNIKTVLRMVRDRVDKDVAAGFLISGGKVLDDDDLNELLAAPSPEKVLALLDETPYRFLKAVPESVLAELKISVLEKRLERYLVKKGVAAFLLDPLSVASVIGYFWAKYNEVTNIRIISRCKTTDLSEETLKEELVYV
jgi:V/A-type H+/Na+-transporting ATPase subunit C